MTWVFIIGIILFLLIRGSILSVERRTLKERVDHLQQQIDGLQEQIRLLAHEMVHSLKREHLRFPDTSGETAAPSSTETATISPLTETPAMETTAAEGPAVETPAVQVPAVETRAACAAEPETLSAGQWAEAGIIEDSPPEANAIIQSEETPLQSKETPLDAATQESWATPRDEAPSDDSGDDAASAPAPKPSRPFDWESLIGVRLFSIVAGIALLVAVVGFLRYSLDRGWLGPPIRMAMGLLVGIGLIVVCETKRAQRYRITAHALTAAGVATLFAVFFASHALWGLIESPLLTFVLLAIVAAVAVLLSIRRNSLFIALLGLAGGFVTPIILSSGDDRPFSLFGYLLLLNIGLSGVAYLKRWPVLVVLSFLGTALYQIGWTVSFFNESRIPLAMGIFVIFPLVGFFGFALRRLRKPNEEVSSVFATTAEMSAVMPVLFAFYLAFTPACGAHFELLFGFLFLLALGFAFIGAFVGPELIHPLMGATVLFATVSFLGRSYTEEARVTLILFTAAFAALYLAAPHLMKRLGRPFQAEGRVGTYFAPILLIVHPIVAGIDPAGMFSTASAPLFFFGTLLVFAAAFAAYALIFEQSIVHFIAAVFVTVSVGVWSTKCLAPESLFQALLVFAFFGLFYFVVPLIAERIGKPFRPQGSGSVMQIAAIFFLFFLSTSSVAGASLPYLTALLFLFNIILFYEASLGRALFFAIVGIVLSWVVLTVWWCSAPLYLLYIPAIATVEGFALFVLGGLLFTHRQNEQKGRTAASKTALYSIYWVLVGHLFLFAVVANPRLVIFYESWPVVLFVLNLAIGAAALFTRNGALQLAAVSLTGLLFLIWTPSAETVGLPPVIVPVAAALLYGGFSLVFMLSAERTKAKALLFNLQAGIGLLFADITVMIATSVVKTDGSFAAALVGHVLILLGILFLSGHTQKHQWSFGALFLFALAPLVSNSDNWVKLLGIAAPIYLLYLFNPIILGARVRALRLPFVTVLLASLIFFFQARHAMFHAEAMGFIGLLPVVQAFLLIPHIRMLLRMEAPSERDKGRLALMAGGILAFVTAAIPLQLEKQWITLGWALEGAALAWLYRRIPHKGILWWLTALLGTVFVRLTVNPAVFSYYPKAALPILNWYLYTWLTAAACFFAAAFLLKSTDDRPAGFMPRLSRILPAAGTILLFLILNIEIADFFSTGDHPTFSLSVSLAQNLSYTIGWGVFAIGLLVAGIFVKSRFTRIVSIVLLAVTVFKAFLFDLSHLTGLYRVASFLGLAICLVLVAVALQRYVIRKDQKDFEA